MFIMCIPPQELIPVSSTLTNPTCFARHGSVHCRFFPYKKFRIFPDRHMQEPEIFLPHPAVMGGCSQISNCLAISKTMSPFSPDGPVQIESKVLQMAIVLSDSRHPLGLLIHSNEAGKRTVLVIAAHSPTICPRIDGHCYNAVANGYADGPPIPKVTWSHPSAGAAVGTLLPFSEGNCFGGKRCCVA